jgi:hypothetical protein
MRGEIYEGPDDKGRYRYGLFWIADYHPGHPLGEHRVAERGQIRFGKLPENVKNWKDLRHGN